MRKLSALLASALVVTFVAGCANQKAPAEQAIAGAEASLAAVRDTAQKYAPEQLKSVEDQLQGLKNSFAKGDYRAVLTGAPTVNSAISALKQTSDTKKAEAEAALTRAKDAWGPMSTDVPKMLEEIEKRVATLSKSSHLPRKVSKANVASAKSGLDPLKSQWGEATSAAASGDYVTALSKGQAARDKAAETMRSLGLSPG